MFSAFSLDDRTMMLFAVDRGMGDLNMYMYRYARYGSCCQGRVPSAIMLVHWSVDD
jgi:hypothetical protein